MAGEPIRIPEVTNGFCGSFGIPFLLTVMCARPKATKSLVQNFGVNRTGIVVHDVIRAQQDVHLAALVAVGAAFAALNRGVRGQRAQFHAYTVAVAHHARNQYPLADEVGNETVGWPTIGPVRNTLMQASCQFVLSLNGPSALTIWWCATIPD